MQGTAKEGGNNGPVPDRVPRGQGAGATAAYRSRHVPIYRVQCVLKLKHLRTPSSKTAKTKN